MKKAFTSVELILVIGIIGILFGACAIAVSMEIHKFNTQERARRSSRKSEFAKLFNNEDARPARIGRRYTIHIDRTKFPGMPETMTVYDAHMVCPGWCKFWLEDGTEVDADLANLIVMEKEEK